MHLFSYEQVVILSITTEQGHVQSTGSLSTTRISSWRFPDFYLSHIYQSDFCQATFTHHTFTHQDFYLSLVLALKKTLTHQFETFTHQSFISSITNEEAKNGNPILQSFYGKAEQNGFSRHLLWTMPSPDLVLHSHLFVLGLNAYFFKSASVKAIFLQKRNMTCHSAYILQ